MIENMKEKTGRSFEEWLELAKKSQLEKHGQIVQHLKTAYGLTHGFANMVAIKYREADAASFSEEDLLAAQYKGKEHLRAIYDVLLPFIQSLGKDVEIVPKKANVSCRRKRQFALLQPSTKTRFDLGLKLDDMPLEGKLEGSGPFGTMCSHRIQLHSVDDIDANVKTWIKMAYEQAG